MKKTDFFCFELINPEKKSRARKAPIPHILAVLTPRGCFGLVLYKKREKVIKID